MDSEERIDGLDIPVERTGGVRLMTVHKSKGLEFPIVFLIDAGSNGRSNKNDAPVYVSAEGGLSVNTGAPPDLRSAASNWFYDRDKAAEAERERAELRRLLYVAMTRAEVKLFVSGCVSPGGDSSDSDDEASEPTPPSQPAVADGWALVAALAGKRKEKAERNFFHFLMPALCGLGDGHDLPQLAISLIPPARRPIKRRADDPSAREGTADTRARTAAARTATYANAPIFRVAPSPKNRFTATGLFEPSDADLAAASPTTGAAQLDLFGPEPASKTSPGQTRASVEAPPLDALDAALATLEMSATDFGSWAHRAIEARFTGLPANVPPEIAALTAEMADRFLDSETGRLARAAAWRESEFAFVTDWPWEGRTVTVSGQIDLVFESGGSVYVVDYKTDRVEDPRLHEGQLRVYRKAAADLFGKPVITRLFYLRTGAERDVT